MTLRDMVEPKRTHHRRYYEADQAGRPFIEIRKRVKYGTLWVDFDPCYPAILSDEDSAAISALAKYAFAVHGRHFRRDACLMVGGSSVLWTGLPLDYEPVADTVLDIIRIARAAFE